MASLLGETGWVHAANIRSPVLKMMLKGYRREDILACPKRLSCSIPATAAVMAEFFITARQVYSTQPHTLSEVSCAAALTYYMSLRANEGAAKTVAMRNNSDVDHDAEESPDTEDGHHLLAKHVFLRFKDDPKFYPAVQGTIFPLGQTPIYLDVIQDSTKTSMARGSQHRSAHPNPNPDKSPFCVIAIAWEYITNFPPPANGAFFPTTLSSHTTTIMHLTADRVGLDRARLSARCVRSGSVSMMRNMKHHLIEAQELIQIRDHGRWAGDTGSHVYAHQNPDAQRLLIAPSLYDSGFMTIAYLRWFYMTPR